MRIYSDHEPAPTHRDPSDPRQALCELVSPFYGEILDRFRTSSPTADVKDRHGRRQRSIAWAERVDPVAYGAQVDHALAVVAAGDFGDNGASGEIDFRELTEEDVVDEAGAGDGRGDGPARSHLVGDVCGGERGGEVGEGEDHGTEAGVRDEEVVCARYGGRAEHDGCSCWVGFRARVRDLAVDDGVGGDEAWVCTCTITFDNDD